MKPEVLKYLFDINRSIDLVEAFTEGMSFLDYQIDYKTKSAVERQLGIIHSYDSVDDTIIWAIVRKHLPLLKQEVGILLSKK